MKALVLVFLGAVIAWFALRRNPEQIYQEKPTDPAAVAVLPPSTPPPTAGNTPTAQPVSAPIAAAPNDAAIPGTIAEPATSALTLTPPPPEILNAIVTISGSEGAGTGFFCRFREKVYVATNQHVLGVGNPLAIRTSSGLPVVVQSISTALDADVALIQCASIPAGATILELAALPDPAVHKDDPTMVPGNSKGDGVITQTPGVLMALGPQRIEVNNPVFAGNSGSPIIHLPTNKVIGILTEAELVRLDEFGKASFRSKNSAIKSEIRYFGHRIDSVQKWAGLDWASFQRNEELIKKSRSELDCIFEYFADSQHYKSFKDLHEAHNSAAKIYFDKSYSTKDKLTVYDRFLRQIDTYARRAAARLDGRYIYSSQKSGVDSITRMATAISAATVIAQRGSDLAAVLLQKAP